MLKQIVPALFAVALVVGCEQSGAPGSAQKPSTDPASSPVATPSPSAPAKPTSTGAPATPASATVASSGLVAASAAAGDSKTAATGKTATGLEYTILKEGSGGPPALGSRVKVHLTGTLPDGKVFMDTRASGAPKEYKLDSLEMIPGWVQTLQTMKVGEKRKVHMPSALAFGVRGFPEVVPPRTDVDFEIELLSFTPPGVK